MPRVEKDEYPVAAVRESLHKHWYTVIMWVRRHKLDYMILILAFGTMVVCPKV